MKIHIIAESPKKESYTVNNQVWYKEFAIGELETEKDRQNMIDQFRANEIYNFRYPCVSMDRRVTITDGIVSYNEWSYYWFEDGIYKTALTLSNGFENAIGIDPLYDRIISHRNTESKLKKELNELDDRITPNKSYRYSPLEQEFLQKYEQELKSRKLWKKAQNNNAPENIVTEIKNRLNEEFKEELNRIITRMDEIKNALMELDNISS